YGRPATLVIDEAPQPWQLIPRPDQAATEVTAHLAGRVTSSDVSAVVLRTTTGSAVTERTLEVVDGAFDAQVPIPVALADTDLEVCAESDDVRRLVRTIPGVVGGDVYVIQGQSNATARRWGSTAHGAQHHFVRTYG